MFLTRYHNVFFKIYFQNIYVLQLLISEYRYLDMNFMRWKDVIKKDVEQLGGRPN